VTILTVHSTGPYKTAVASRIADAEPSPNKVNFCIGKAPSGANSFDDRIRKVAGALIGLAEGNPSTNIPLRISRRRGDCGKRCDLIPAYSRAIGIKL
jgi:hypothetical protein